MSCLRLLAGFVVLACCISSAIAQDVGDKVVVRTDSAVLKSGKDTVGTAKRGQGFEVLKLNGEWLWVQGELDGKTVKGWVNRSQVEVATTPDKTNPGTPAAQSPQTGDVNPSSSGNLWIDEKAHALKYAVAYQAKYRDDDPNLFTYILATTQPVKNAELQKLKAEIDKGEADARLSVWNPHVELIFDPDGGLMSYSGWADNVSLSGNSDVEAEITLTNGAVQGKAVMAEAQEIFDKKFRFEVSFNLKLTTFKAAAAPKPAKSAAPSEPAPPVAEMPAKTTGPVLAIDLNPQPRPFSQQAMHLPFPPDAREVEFDASFRDVEYTSASSLDSLAKFYQVQMQARDWIEDTAEASVEDDEIEMTFKHEEFEVVVTLSKNSDKETEVDIDCEKLKWDGIDDPSGLVAAGVPQARSVLLLQQEIPRPQAISKLTFEDDECKFESTDSAKTVANFYIKELQKRGWKSQGSPTLFDQLCSLNYAKGPVTLDFTIFGNADGSRVMIRYENESPEPKVPTLAALAKGQRLPTANPGEPSTPMPSETPMPTETPLDFSTIKGSATVTYGGKKYVFNQVAAYQSKNSGEYRVIVQYANRPIPYDKMLPMINEEGFSFSELYRYNAPQMFGLTLTKGEISISFSAAGTTIYGQESDFATHDASIKNGRIAGSFKMTQPEEILDENFQFEAKIDAPILRPSDWEPLDSLTLRLSEEHGPPLPDNVVDVKASNTRYRKGATATVRTLNLPETLALYRDTLEKEGWSEDDDLRDSSGQDFIVGFHNEERDQQIYVRLIRDDPQTNLDVALRYPNRAKEDGFLPEPGQSMLVLGNASKNDVVVELGDKSWTVKAGTVADGQYEPVKEPLDPGPHEFTFKIPGQDDRTETLPLRANCTWGINISTEGELQLLQLY